MMKIYHCDDNHYIVETLSLWWKFIPVIKINHSDENMKNITIMKIYHCDEDESWWWKLLPLMKIYHSKKKNSSLWWIFIWEMIGRYI